MFLYQVNRRTMKKKGRKEGNGEKFERSLPVALFLHLKISNHSHPYSPNGQTKLTMQYDYIICIFQHRG